MNSKFPPLKGKRHRPYAIYVYASFRTDGYSRAGYGWLECGTATKEVVFEENRNPGQLEFRAIESAVERLPDEADAQIYSSSNWVYHNFYGRHKLDPVTRKHLNRIREVTRQRGLKVDLIWIPRGNNIATGLLQRPDSEVDDTPKKTSFDVYKEYKEKGWLTDEGITAARRAYAKQARLDER